LREEGQRVDGMMQQTSEKGSIDILGQTDIEQTDR